MSHPPDDKLLELVLDLLDESEVQTLREHLSECADCQARFARIHSRTEVLGSVSPAGRPPAYPGRRSRPRVLPSILKAAALLLLGFCGGFATGEYVRPESVNVVPSCLAASSPPDSVARYAASDATRFATGQM
jgi:hypothetical protein